jgi:MFS family permease
MKKSWKSEKKGQSGKSHLSGGEKNAFCSFYAPYSFGFSVYNAVITYFSNYAATVLALEGGAFLPIYACGNLAGIVSFLPAGMIATKIGRKKTIIAGIVVLTAAFAGGIFLYACFPGHLSDIRFCRRRLATINVNSLPMIVEFAAGNIGQYTCFILLCQHERADRYADPCAAL